MRAFLKTARRNSEDTGMSVIRNPLNLRPLASSQQQQTPNTNQGKMDDVNNSLIELAPGEKASFFMSTFIRAADGRQSPPENTNLRVPLTTKMYRVRGTKEVQRHMYSRNQRRRKIFRHQWDRASRTLPPISTAAMLASAESRACVHIMTRCHPFSRHFFFLSRTSTL